MFGSESAVNAMADGNITSCHSHATPWNYKRAINNPSSVRAVMWCIYDFSCFENRAIPCNIEMYVDVLFSLFFSGSTSKAFHNCASLVNVFRLNFSPARMCRMTRAKHRRLTMEAPRRNIDFEVTNEKYFRNENSLSSLKSFLKTKFQKNIWNSNRSNSIFAEMFPSVDTKREAEASDKKKTRINRNSFLLATYFDLLLLSCQFWQLRSRANANLKAKRERKALISCFDGYERKSLLILWCEEPWRSFSNTISLCSSLCLLEESFINIFFFRWTSSTSLSISRIGVQQCQAT